ncbi:MAG TPA: hypothetical protein VF902_09360 [Coriobacteriia bacterium]
MTRKSDLQAVAKGDARRAQAKAQEFAEAAAGEIGAERWNAAGLDAVHAGICAADAALIATAGLRSVSQDHAAVTASLEEQVPEFGASQRRQLAGLLRMKNTVAYEQRLLTGTEARQMTDQARRLAQWSRKVVEARLS